MLPELDNWQFVLISRKINFEYERYRNYLLVFTQVIIWFQLVMKNRF